MFKISAKPKEAVSVQVEVSPIPLVILRDKTQEATFAVQPHELNSCHRIFYHLFTLRFVQFCYIKFCIQMAAAATVDLTYTASCGFVLRVTYQH